MTTPQETTLAACPHCGAEEIISFPYEGICRLGHQKWKCETPFVRCASGEITEVTFRTDLCRERDKRQKAEEQYLEMAEAASQVPDLEAEVERLRDRANRILSRESELLIRAEAAEAEVERLREALKSCWWATKTYDGNYTKACDDVAEIATNALKPQDK